MSASEALHGDPEQTFLDHLPVIDRIIGVIAHRHSISASDAEEFGAWARERLIADDYAVLRKFAGRSSLRTYLSVVLTNSFKDYRNSTWGRWRPSVAATRLGPIGIRLEELLYRDNYPLREAIAVLQSAGTQLSDTEIMRLEAKIPQRLPTTDVGIERMTNVVADPDADPAAASEKQELARMISEVIAQLPSDERVILRMHYWDNVKVADIARALGLEQKPLYRKLESIQSRLQRWLGERGIDRERALEFLAVESIWQK